MYGASNVAGSCSPTVVTQPYRAPEILLGCTSYTTAIDIWACGCVFAEMCSATILFAGDSDIGQLFRIFELLGTPGPNKPCSWAGVERLPYYNADFPAMKPKDFATNPPTLDLCRHPAAEDLLRKMLVFDPSLRITAAEALHHPFLADESPLIELHISSPQQLGSSGAQATGSSCHHAGALPLNEGASPTPAASGGGVSAGVHTPVDTHRGSSSMAPSESLRSGRSAKGDGSSSGSMPCVWDTWRNVEKQQATRRQRAFGVVAPLGSSGELNGATASGSAASVRAAQATQREEAVHWVLRSSMEFCKCDRTVHLAVAILDQVLVPAGTATDLTDSLAHSLARSLARSLNHSLTHSLQVLVLRAPPSEAQAITNGTRSWTHLVAVSSLLLACKFQEVEIHMVDEFVHWSSNCYEPSEVLAAEVRICSALGLDFAIPSALDFLYCLLQRLRWPAVFSVHRGLHKQVVMPLYPSFSPSPTPTPLPTPSPSPSPTPTPTPSPSPSPTPTPSPSPSPSPSR